MKEVVLAVLVLTPFWVPLAMFALSLLLQQGAVGLSWTALVLSALAILALSFWAYFVGFGQERNWNGCYALLASYLVIIHVCIVRLYRRRRRS